MGRSRRAGACLLAAWLAGLACAAAWAGVAAVGAWQAGGVAIALIACGAIALRGWMRSPAGVLAWDGAAWRWTVGASALEGEVEVALDAQRALLLRWRGTTGGVLWLWLDRGADHRAWDDLRRAVYSRARPGAFRAAEGEARP